MWKWLVLIALLATVVALVIENLVLARVSFGAFILCLFGFLMKIWGSPDA